MAYIQQNTPPPNRVMNFSLSNFSGGLNNRSHVLEPNEAFDVLNMAFSADDIMEKRFGSTYFDGMQLDKEVTFVDEFEPYDDPKLIVRASRNEIWFGTTRDRTTLGNVSGSNHNGKYFYCDGYSYFVFGKFPQSSSTYVKIVGSATTGNRSFRIKSVLPADFTPLDTTHTQGVTVYNYGAGTIHYEPCALEIADTFKGHSVVPDYVKYLISKDGRLYLSGGGKTGIIDGNSSDDTVFISDIANPYYLPVVMSLQLPPNSDKMMGMHVYDDKLVVGRRDDIHVISGNTNRTDIEGAEVYSLKQLNTHTGFASHNAINRVHNYLFFLGNDGNCYLLGNATGSETVVATQILTKSVNMFKDPIKIKRADLGTACSIFYEDSWYLSIKDKVLVYSYRHKAWSVYSNLFARSFYNYNGVLIWGNVVGDIAIPSTDYLDFGVPFRAHWTSGQFDMDDANSFKQFREFFIVCHTFDDYISDVDVSFEVDHANVPSKSRIRNQIVKWGESLFGDRFLTRNINASVPFVIGRRGRTIRITVSNGYFFVDSVALISDLNSYTGQKNHDMVYVVEDTSYYKFEDRKWQKLSLTDDLNQPMRVYEINGSYELRGKR